MAEREPLAQDTYTHGHHASVVAQHARRSAEECAAFARGVIGEDSQVLDVGCGPGSITVGLARWAASGRVVGVDASEEILEAAGRAVAEAGVDNVELQAASVYELPFSDGSFDVAYAHQVLQHLSDPVAALGEMARVVRSGGYVAVRDADYSTMRGVPGEANFDRWRELYDRVCRRNGAEPNAGRYLLGWCRAAGLGEVEMSASVWQFSEEAERRNWGESWAQRCEESDFAKQAVSYGFASEQDLAEIAQGWRDWAEAGDGYFHFIHAAALARVSQGGG